MNIFLFFSLNLYTNIINIFGLFIMNFIYINDYLMINYYYNKKNEKLLILENKIEKGNELLEELIEKRI